MRDGWLRTLRITGKKIGLAAVGVLLASGCASQIARAQTAEQAWLKYSSDARPQLPMFGEAKALSTNLLEQTAAREVGGGQIVLADCYKIAGPNSKNRKPQSVPCPRQFPGETVVGTVAEVRKAFPDLPIPKAIGAEGYWIYQRRAKGKALVVVAGQDERGVLYGAFELVRRMAEGQDISHINVTSRPAMPVRWVDEWDNIDGSVERGYGGRSIFFDAGHVRQDLTPVREYARLLASIGINGCNINNVNNAAPFLKPEMLAEIKRIADTMRPYGVRVALSADVASPKTIGGLATYDPLDPAVIAWWKAKVDEIYQYIPDFAGFTVKADSEGQPGPASYGRTPADAANTLAAALKPHGGVVLYRAFVYNHHLDWNDPKADRARAAYDIFHPLDGKFDDNVIVQVKEGPIDFQAQEPVSPLFAGLEKTNQAMELQITQEYLGQQRHLVYIAPMWKWVLDFDLKAGTEGQRDRGTKGPFASAQGRLRDKGTEGVSTPVKEIIEGKSFHRPLGGMIGVSCVGQDWLGSPMALANLYAFGRLAWNPDLTAEEIAREWAHQTFGTDPLVVRTVTKMLMQSWPAYVDYTGPLGMQTLTGITGSHYGPDIEASENNGWGQWHRADHLGVGMDRTVATGTGFVGQYPPAIAKIYEDVNTTPDNLLTFFHHVPYTWKLHDGKTVIQYIYDSHYQGADEAAELGTEWATLKGKVDPAFFADETARLAYQAGHAIVWRDAINQYFLKLSGIPDAKGRAGHYPGRLEAESAKLTGYQVIPVKPWEDASEGQAVSCPLPQESAPEKTCAAEWIVAVKPGRYRVAIQYFDLQGGNARFRFLVNGHEEAAWVADAKLPSRRPHGDNSTRFTTGEIDLKQGDTLRVEGTPDGRDPAALDYVELEP